MCNTVVYPAHVLHVQNMCIIYVCATYVILLYFYTCNAHKTHMYYICSTTGHVVSTDENFLII